MSEMVFPVRFDAETGARVRRHAAKLKQKISVVIRNAIMREIEGGTGKMLLHPSGEITAAPSRNPLRALREAAGLSQSQAADRLGISRGAWANAEKAAAVTPAMLERARKAFGVRP